MVRRRELVTRERVEVSVREVGQRGVELDAVQPVERVGPPVTDVVQQRVHVPGVEGRDLLEASLAELDLPFFVPTLTPPTPEPAPETRREGREGF